MFEDPPKEIQSSPAQEDRASHCDNTPSQQTPWGLGVHMPGTGENSLPHGAPVSSYLHGDGQWARVLRLAMSSFRLHLKEP